MLLGDWFICKANNSDVEAFIGNRKEHNVVAKRELYSHAYIFHMDLLEYVITLYTCRHRLYRYDENENSGNNVLVNRFTRRRRPATRGTRFLREKRFGAARTNNLRMGAWPRPTA